MNGLINRQAAIGTIKHMKDVCDTDDINDYYNLLIDAFGVMPSAQSKKFSEVLRDMMDEDYYLFCHTGYSRLAEKDWEWLIEQVKEIEQSERRTDNANVDA